MLKLDPWCQWLLVFGFALSTGELVIDRRQARWVNL